MGPRNILIMTSAVLMGLSAHAASGANAPKGASSATKPQVQQSSSGCASPNVGENSGRIEVRVACNYNTIFQLDRRMNSLEVNQERLLLAQHPTELRITNAYFRSWLPDGQRLSLTLEFENPRDIPIPEIEIDFLDPESGASIGVLKPIPFTQSQVYREIGTHKFSLSAGGKTALPVAFLDEIVGRQSIGSELCAFDAALTTDFPDDVSPSSLVKPTAGSRQTEHRPLLLRARFKSIFEQQLSSSQWVWIVYGQGSEGMQFWYPSKKRWDKLICAR